MNNTLLFYIESLNTLKARRWALSQKEFALLQDIQKLILAQAQIDEQIDLWEVALGSLRKGEKIKTCSSSS